MKSWGGNEYKSKNQATDRRTVFKELVRRGKGDLVKITVILRNILI